LTMTLLRSADRNPGGRTRSRANFQRRLSWGYGELFEGARSAVRNTGGRTRSDIFNAHYPRNMGNFLRERGVRSGTLAGARDLAQIFGEPVKGKSNLVSSQVRLGQWLGCSKISLTCRERNFPSPYNVVLSLGLTAHVALSQQRATTSRNLSFLAAPAVDHRGVPQWSERGSKREKRSVQFLFLRDPVLWSSCSRLLRSGPFSPTLTIEEWLLQ